MGIEEREYGGNKCQDTINCNVPFMMVCILADELHDPSTDEKSTEIECRDEQVYHQQRAQG